MNIRFISKNVHKIKEIEDFFSEKREKEKDKKNKEIRKFCSSEKELQDRVEKEVMKVMIYSSNIDIKEIQSEDVKKIVKDKATKAFKKIGKPLIVEHTGLFFKDLSGYPGGLTQIFWDSLKGEKVVELFAGQKVTAKTMICFCDGKKFNYFTGEVKGKIATDVRGDSKFQWDTVFIPEGSDKTFAEMGRKKQEVSMRRDALEKLYEFLKDNEVKLDDSIEYEDEIKELAELIKDDKVMLFVGAGISKNVGLPSWGDLIDKLSESCGISPELFECYGEFLSLAEFYEYYDKDLFRLKKWMKDKWKVTPEMIDDSTVHEKILDLDFPIIYTTNYDECLEKLYEYNSKVYRKISKVEDLKEIKAEETQIIKFHGDYNTDSPLVLTESSYFKRMDFESPLDIKLRSDILTKSILFIGYSLSDINMRYILYKLDKLWRESGSEKDRPRAYIFLTTPNIVQESILERWGITPIISSEDNAGKGVQYFLERLKELSK